MIEKIGPECSSDDFFAKINELVEVVNRFEVLISKITIQLGMLTVLTVDPKKPLGAPDGGRE